MAFSLNKVQLLGNVGKDPVVRHTNDGKPIVSFSIATSESWKDKSSGERQEKTFWHNVVIFNEHVAKVAEQYVKQGSQVYIEGTLQTRKWADKDGADRYSTEVVVQAFKGELGLVGRKGEGGGSGVSQEGGGGGQSNPTPKRSAPSRAHDLDDEVPF